MTLSLQRYMQPDCNSPLIQLLKERSKKERERAISITIEDGDYCLHESVIIEILSWLPVRNLLQYKSVCKSWYAIISSPDFISKHLKNYYNNNYDWRGCLLAQYCLNRCEIQSFVMFVDETPRLLALENLFHMPMYSSYIYGPCDGLYYLFHHFHQQRALWNPAINDLKVLPPLITKSNPPLDTMYAAGEDFGFGYDPVSRDYKVVVIRGYRNTIDDNIDYPQSVLVYSLRNDSWRYCGDLRRHYDLDNNNCYIFLNGCCYWLESIRVYEKYWSESDYVYEDWGAIISFNMAVDAFEEITLPNYKQPASQCLAIYDDSLALLSFHKGDTALELWTLKEGIWTMKFTVGPFPDVWRPIGHWEDNKLILESENGKLLLLDPESQDIKDFAFQYPNMCLGISVCRESLVSIKGESHHGKGEDHRVAER